MEAVDQFLLRVRMVPLAVCILNTQDKLASTLTGQEVIVEGSAAAA
jgi:hypothetical protein